MKANWLWPLLAAGLACGAPPPTFAGDSAEMPRTVPPAYARECASCHVAYPPGMLPARSWQRIMAGLDRHYGSDASLDAATVQQIGAWLQLHAGTYRNAAEAVPQDRITRSAWFVREHRKVAPSVWRLPSVKSAANCAACHTDAPQGRFDESQLRPPAGLPQTQRHEWLD